MALASVSVDWLAIVVASVASFIFGWIWYGPLFGKIWLKGSGMSGKEMKKHKGGMGGKMIWSFVGTLVMSYVLSNVIVWAGVSGFNDVAMLGAWLGIGFFAATTLLGEVLWKGRPWKFFLLNSVYWILNLIIVGAVILAF